jgi:hypothetical protein
MADKAIRCGWGKGKLSFGGLPLHWGESIDYPLRFNYFLKIYYFVSAQNFLKFSENSNGLFGIGGRLAGSNGSKGLKGKMGSKGLSTDLQGAYATGVWSSPRLFF